MDKKNIFWRLRWLILVFLAIGVTILIIWILNLTVLAPVTITNQEISKQILNWLWDNRDERGLTPMVGNCVQEDEILNCTADLESASFRHSAAVIWARYNYWLATKDSEELERLKQNINDYHWLAIDPEGWLIQPDNYHFYYLAQVYLSQEPEITQDIKDKLLYIAQVSEPEGELWLDENNGFLEASTEALITDINYKLNLIVYDELDLYDGTNDPFFLAEDFVKQNFAQQVEELQAAQDLGLERYSDQLMLASFNGALSHYLNPDRLRTLPEYGAMMSASKIMEKFSEINYLEYFQLRLQDDLDRVQIDYLSESNNYAYLAALALDEHISWPDVLLEDNLFLQALRQEFIDNKNLLNENLGVVIDEKSNKVETLPNAILAGLLMVSEE